MVLLHEEKEQKTDKRKDKVHIHWKPKKAHSTGELFSWHKVMAV